MDKEEAKKRMECCITNYLDRDKILRILAKQDPIQLANLKLLSDKVDNHNAAMKNNIDNADSKQFETMVNTFRFPLENEL